jgi:hypothetical protein
LKLLLLIGIFVDNFIARNVLFDVLVLGEEKLRSAGAAILKFVVDDGLTKWASLESHGFIPYLLIIGTGGIQAGWEAWIRTKIP